jgi:hypothetical protein
VNRTHQTTSPTTTMTPDVVASFGMKEGECCGEGSRSLQYVNIYLFILRGRIVIMTATSPSGRTTGGAHHGSRGMAGGGGITLVPMT